MKALLFFCLAVVLGVAELLVAKPMESEPALAEAFPLVAGEGGVRVSMPVLLNGTTILKPSAVLRVCYIMPQSDDPLVRKLAAEGNQDSAYSRRVVPAEGEKPPPPEVQAAVRIATKVVWPHPENFKRAFMVMNAGDMRLVFVEQRRDGKEEFYDEMMNWPEGLLLGEGEGGGIQVLAVEKGRSGAAAGVQAGDQLLKIGRHRVTGGLDGFLQVYRAAKEEVATASGGVLEFQVERGGKPVELGVRRPPSLKGSLLDLE